MADRPAASTSPAIERVAGDGPGAILRAARVQQGMHIAMLAAALKVPPARIEALEAGRWDELPDPTFARALALSVCRTLKIDPAPVLAQLPQAWPPAGLDKLGSGLNAPFRDRPDRMVSTPWRRPAWWAAGLLVVGAAAFVLVPPRGVAPTLPAAFPPASAPAAAAAPVESASAAAAVAVAEPAAALPAPEPASAPPPDAALAAAQGAVLAATAPTWVQAVDGSGQVLISRVIAAGESLELVGTPPIRVRIGNVAGTELQFRGKPVDLASIARDNTATVELR